MQRESSQVVRIERHRVEGNLVALTFADPAEPRDDRDRPTAFVLHGLGSRKERHLDLCLRLADAGLRAVAIDAVGHGDRATPDSRRALADIHAPEFLPAFAETVAGTVRDIAATATSLGAARYGLIGHSMGGFIALQTLLADPERAAWTVSIAGALPDDPRVPPAIRARLRTIDPALPPRPVLLLHGDADDTVPVQGSRLLAAALRAAYPDRPDVAELREYPGAGHELRPEMVADAVAWAARQASRAAV